MNQKTPATAPANEADANFGDPLTMPGGKVLTILKATKGKHMRQAGRMAADKPQDPLWNQFCYAVVICRIDGAPFVPEDMDEMSTADVSFIMEQMSVATTGKSLAELASAASQ